MKLPRLPEAKDVLVPNKTDPYPMRLAQYAMEIVLTQFVFHLVGIRTILLYGEDDRVKEGLCVGKEGGLSQDIWENCWIKEKRFKSLRRIWQTQQLVILLCSSALPKNPQCSCTYWATANSAQKVQT